MSIDATIVAGVPFTVAALVLSATAYAVRAVRHVWRVR